MNKGPKGKQKPEKPGSGNNDSKYAPERHETDETLQEQPLVNEEKQKKIVNEQNEHSSETDTSDTKTNLRDRDGEIGEKIPAMD